MPLTSSDRKYLRGLAHPLNPIVQIGKKGLTEALIKEVDDKLTQHELIKIKFADLKEEKDSVTDDLVAKTGSFQAGIIGHILILYRANPKKPVIKLPVNKS